MIKRSLKLSLALANTGKQQALDHLWNAYKKALQDFLDRLFSGNDLSESFLKSYQSPLSYRYLQCAKRQALKMFKCWCRNKRKGAQPSIHNPSMTLDYRFVELQHSHNSFDFWVKLACLRKGKPLFIPVQSYDYLNHYLAHWELARGGRLVKQDGKWLLILTFRKERPAPKSEGRVLGCDIGYRKLVTTSEGHVYGGDARKLVAKAARKTPFSKGYYRAKSEIKNYVNCSLKQLFSADLQAVVVEDLKHLKQGKHGMWSRAVNRKFNFWIYGYALGRIQQLCEVAGVQCHKVAAKDTSRTCPQCGRVEKANRAGETFRCIACDFTGDADVVGAHNILMRWTTTLGDVGSIWQGAYSPLPCGTSARRNK